MEPIRLQKFLANNGIASRRKCEELILQGKITVNGEAITELGRKVNPDTDEVMLDGKKVENHSEELVYILLNKPIGVVTTSRDQFNRESVLDLVKVPQRIVPVGRLDMYTSGALLLTNDGQFVYQLTHPKHEITKTYNATIVGIVTEEEIETLRKGVKIEDYVTRPAKVKILKSDSEKNISRIQITIHEGKNRQVRKMCQAINKKVIALHRSSIGEINVKDLKLGTWRYLKQSEVQKFK